MQLREHTKMHPAWQIDDICQLLFAHLDPASLARLSWTCKALINVRIGRLWKIVTLIAPFICCLPIDYMSPNPRCEEHQET